MNANVPDTTTTTSYASLSDEVSADMLIYGSLNLFMIALGMFCVTGSNVRIGYFVILIII